MAAVSSAHAILFHSLQASSLDSQWVGWQCFVPYTISRWLPFLQASLFAQKGTQKRAIDKAKGYYVKQGSWPVIHASLRAPSFFFRDIAEGPLYASHTHSEMAEQKFQYEENTEKWSHFDVANWKGH